MTAGQLDIRIAVQQLGSLDALGQPTGTPILIGSMWAKRQPQRGREILAAGTIGDEQTEVFTVRYRTDIEPKHIVEYSGVRYRIANIVEAQRREWLDLVCVRFE